MVVDVTSNKHDLPPTLDYASPSSDAPIPGSEIVSEFLGGFALLVFASLFCGGAVISILRDFRGVLSWILSILYVAVGVAFALGGAQEIHRGISHHCRR